MIRLWILVAATLFSVAAHATLNVSMRVHPETTLPGLPVSFSFNLTNSSTAPVTIIGSVNLEVTAADGATYFATWDSGQTSTAFPAELDERLTIPAAGTRELYIPLDTTLVGPEFFWDRRLNQPGRFLLRAYLYAEPLRADGTYESITSNQALLEVRAPEGDDLAVWKTLIAETSIGVWTVRNWASMGLVTAAQILSRYPDSGYAPYLTMVHATQTQQERLDAIDRALAQRPSGPVADMLIERRGAVHSLLSNQAFGRGDLDRAEAEARKAQAVLRDLIRTTSYEFVRDEATKTLQRVKEPEHIRGMFEAIHATDPPAPLQVVPHVDCVEQFGSTIVARFGYTNPNRVGKYIQVGGANRLIPDDGGERQPRYFMPGRHAEMVSAIGAKGKQPSWRLDGNEATVTPQTPACAGVRALVRPIIECVRHENEGVVVTFGYENPNPFAVVVPAGDANRFQGELIATRQPEVFLAGRQVNVFKAKAKDDPLTWLLDGRSVTASPRAPFVCAGR